MRKERGRGATENQTSHRFGLPAHAADGDWLDLCETVDGPAPKLRTRVTTEHPRTIITRNASLDIPFDRSINAYRGCEHGCIYCYARPSHAFHDLSPGLDFETRLFAKPAAAKLLRAELAKPAYRPAPIAMGTNTDPYQPIEGQLRITRAVLEVCLETRHPVTITTKSARVLRDIELLAELARLGLTAVSISVTSLDPKLSGLLEPRASAPAKRLDALARLAAAGVPTHVSVAPVIPAITDHFIEGILETAAARGVQTASWIMLRLPHEVAPLFKAWLATHFPDRAAKVLHTVQAMRRGKDNDPGFFTRMKPNGVWADMFRTRFRVASRRLGLNRVQPALDCNQFIKPSANGQLRLL
jgi:DNA repair photolyase